MEETPNKAAPTPTNTAVTQPTAKVAPALSANAVKKPVSTPQSAPSTPQPVKTIVKTQISLSKYLIDYTAKYKQGTLKKVRITSYNVCYTKLLRMRPAYVLISHGENGKGAIMPSGAKFAYSEKIGTEEAHNSQITPSEGKYNDVILYSDSIGGKFDDVIISKTATRILLDTGCLKR